MEEGIDIIPMEASDAASDGDGAGATDDEEDENETSAGSMAA